MAITGLSKIETSEYISEADSCATEADGATVFLLGAVDKETLGALRDNAQTIEFVDGKQSMVMNNAAMMVRACRIGLRGWRNFKDIEGKDIPFRVEDGVLFGKEMKLVSQETIDKMPFDLVIELGRAIVAKNSKLDSKLLKNSQTQ